MMFCPSLKASPEIIAERFSNSGRRTRAKLAEQTLRLSSKLCPEIDHDPNPSAAVITKLAKDPRTIATRRSQIIRNSNNELSDKRLERFSLLAKKLLNYVNRKDDFINEFLSEKKRAIRAYAEHEYFPGNDSFPAVLTKLRSISGFRDKYKRIARVITGIIDIYSIAEQYDSEETETWYPRPVPETKELKSIMAKTINNATINLARTLSMNDSLIVFLNGLGANLRRYSNGKEKLTFVSVEGQSISSLTAQTENSFLKKEEFHEILREVISGDHLPSLGQPLDRKITRLVDAVFKRLDDIKGFMHGFIERAYEDFPASDFARFVPYLVNSVKKYASASQLKLTLHRLLFMAIKKCDKPSLDYLVAHPKSTKAVLNYKARNDSLRLLDIANISFADNANGVYQEMFDSLRKAGAKLSIES